MTKENLNKIHKEPVDRRLWKVIIPSIFVFLSGVLIAWYVINNKAEGVRSNENNTEEYAQVVSIYVQNPSATLQSLVIETIKSKLPFSVKKNGVGYEVLIEDLTPNSPEQEPLKDVLGIGHSASGNVQFQIRFKNH